MTVVLSGLQAILIIYMYVVGRKRHDVGQLGGPIMI